MELLGRRSEAQRATLDQLGLTSPGKLVRYANSGEGSSSGASGRELARLAADSSSDEEEEEEEEEEEVPVRNLQLQSGDYVLNDEEEATAVKQVSVISAAKVRTRFRREEAEAVHAVREYEAAKKEVAVRRVKQEVVDLDSE